TYFVGVLSSSGGSNYHVRVTADYAGETPDTQRAMGSLDTGKSFNDFIGAPDDLVDQYKFHLSASRPVHLVSIEQDGTSLLELFKFTAVANGMVGASIATTTGDADLALIRDANNNGKIDAGEILASATPVAAGGKELSKSILAGNYFLRVTHVGPSKDAQYFL